MDSGSKPAEDRLQAALPRLMQLRKEMISLLETVPKAISDRFARAINTLKTGTPGHIAQNTDLDSPAEVCRPLLELTFALRHIHELSRYQGIDFTPTKDLDKALNRCLKLKPLCYPAVVRPREIQILPAGQDPADLLEAIGDFRPLFENNYKLNDSGTAFIDQSTSDYSLDPNFLPSGFEGYLLDRIMKARPLAEVISRQIFAAPMQNMAYDKVLITNHHPARIISYTLEENRHLTLTVHSHCLAYGGSWRERNELLEFQAIAQALRIDGKPCIGSVEMTGRVDPQFMRWASGADFTEQGALPHLTFIYSLPLPSDKIFRFILKRGDKTTPPIKDISEYSDEERRIITGVHQAILDRSIFTLLNLFEPRPSIGSSYRAELLRMNPFLEPDPDCILAFDEERLRGLWRALIEKADQAKVAHNQSLSILSPQCTEAEVRRVYREMQSQSSRDLHVGLDPRAFLLEPQHEDAVVTEAWRRIQKITDFEQERARQSAISGTAEWQDTQRRIKLGYSGPPEGFSLTIPFVLTDVIKAFKHKLAAKSEAKPCRSYEHPERFPELTQITELLAGLPEQRYLEVTVRDPRLEDPQLDKKRKFEPRQVIAVAQADKSMARLEQRIIAENERRQDELLLGSASEIILASFTELEHAADTIKKAREIKIQRAAAEAKVKKVTFSPEERNALCREEETALAELRQKKAALLTRSPSMLAEQTLHLITIAGILDQELAKVIYCVLADHRVIINREFFRERVVHETHSEQAQGRNIYAGGELVFARHDLQFSTFAEWQDFQVSLRNNVPRPWHLQEINDGTGHYLVKGDSLAYGRRVIWECLQATKMAPSVLAPLSRIEDIRTEDVLARRLLTSSIRDVIM